MKAFIIHYCNDCGKEIKLPAPAEDGFIILEISEIITYICCDECAKDKAIKLKIQNLSA